MDEIAKELLDALRDLHGDIEGLIGESAGVYGLHLNGDVSPWSELEEGGRFERLCSMSKASAAIAKAETLLSAPQPSTDSWIPWAGGECPVAKGVLVDVRFRDGEELLSVPAQTRLPIHREANGRFWYDEGMGNDIIAYRIAKVPQ